MNTALGEKICKLRKGQGLTQEQLAQKINVSSQAVSKWETGVTSPDITLLPRLCGIFNISADELLGVSAKATMVESGEDISKLMLYIKIESDDGDRVNINLPFSIVVKALEMNLGSINIGGKTDALKNVDFSQLLEAVKMGVRGKIIDIKSVDGDSVEIIVE